MKVLILASHPDDAEICMGGTIASMVKEGYEVVIYICSIPDQIEKRKQEALESANILGATLQFLKTGFGKQVEDFKRYELVWHLDKIIEEFKPNIIFTHWREDVHYDHKILFDAVMATSRKTNAEYYSFGPPNLEAYNNLNFIPNSFSDISNSFEMKINAINRHKTQTKEKNYLIDTAKTMAKTFGKQINKEYAEGFIAYKSRLLKNYNVEND